MAITLDHLVPDGNIEVIIRSDSALDVTDDEYEAYVATLNEGLLKYKDGEEPTRWVMKRKMTYKHKQMIEGSKIKIEKGAISAQLGFMIEEVRASLIDIKDPESVPTEKRLKTHFKRNGDGLVQEEFILSLGGIVQELFNVRTMYLATAGSKGADVKKS